MEIKPNDHKLTDDEKKSLDNIRKKVMEQLEVRTIAIIYAGNRWNAESYDMIVGKQFKDAGYYVAFDYVPNGYRSMIVSRLPIGEPSGRLVTRRFL